MTIDNYLSWARGKKKTQREGTEVFKDSVKIEDTERQWLPLLNPSSRQSCSLNKIFTKQKNSIRSYENCFLPNIVLVCQQKKL